MELLYRDSYFVVRVEHSARIVEIERSAKEPTGLGAVLASLEALFLAISSADCASYALQLDETCASRPYLGVARVVARMQEYVTARFSPAAVVVPPWAISDGASGPGSSRLWSEPDLPAHVHFFFSRTAARRALLDLQRG